MANVRSPTVGRRQRDDRRDACAEFQHCDSDAPGALSFRGAINSSAQPPPCRRLDVCLLHASIALNVQGTGTVCLSVCLSRRRRETLSIMNNNKNTTTAADGPDAECKIYLLTVSLSKIRQRPTLRCISWLIRNRFIAVGSVYTVWCMVSAAIRWQHKIIDLVDICTDC